MAIGAAQPNRAAANVPSGGASVPPIVTPTYRSATPFPVPCAAASCAAARLMNKGSAAPCSTRSAAARAKAGNGSNSRLAAKGSSAAAIVAGIKLGGLITGHEISDQTIQNYATEFEGHPDNVAASLYGGFLASCTCHDDAVVSAKFVWPAQIRVVVVSPHSQLPTHVARAALPRSVSRHDAVHNLQRSALFISAIAQQRYDILWEAMRDRLHQPQRESLVPGLKEALALPRMPGLLGIALSGVVFTMVFGAVCASGTGRCFDIGNTVRDALTRTRGALAVGY